MLLSIIYYSLLLLFFKEENIGFLTPSKFLKNKKMLGRNTAYLHHPRPPSSSAIDLDGVEILLHHHQYLHHQHHQEASFPGLYLASSNAAAPLEGSAFFSQENGGEAPKVPAKKATTKKDRHSKIHTSQGPRDRRVRLSIGIARKFFDLQETLGFDKPSKTLDWLLTKSKTAIMELVQKKQSSSSSPSACELHSPAGEDVENGEESKRKAAKESRAKARARARERTLEKMCFKQLSSDLNPSFHCRNNNQLEFLQLSAGGSSSSNNVPIYHHSLSSQDLIQESAAIKRRSKNPPPSSSSSSILGFQHNNHLVFSTDLNANYMTPSANSAAHHENWDCFGLNSQSNLHAVFDQHKFFNSWR